MAMYYASNSTYGPTHNRAEPATHGRSNYDRSDPPTYGRSHETTDPSYYTHGSSNKIYSPDRNFGSYPTTTHQSGSGWSMTKDRYDANNGRKWREGSTKPAAYEGGRGFDEYVTKVATEYIRPSSSTSSCRHRYKPNGCSDYINKEPYKSSSYPVQGENYGNYDSYSKIKEYSSTVPTTYSSQYGTSRPSHDSWTTSPSHYSQLSNPTNDIGQAVHYLDEAARTTGHGPRHGETASTKMHPDYVEPVVDPSKRYGSYNMFAKRSTGQ